MKLKYLFPGNTAPLAILFTLVSMSFTIAYLKNTFSQAAMEKYRYAEWKALYVAEAGLNDVGVVILPQITGDTTLYAEGRSYGDDENGEHFGKYKNITARTALLPNTTRKQYIAQSTGVAEYVSTNGTDVSVERTVYTSMVPQGFEEFMYFTNEEKPIGPGNTGTVNFGASDQLEGKVHTNGDIIFSNYGCPEFSGQVNITNEAVANGGGIGSWGACDESVFEEDIGGETVTILDTVDAIIFPPENSADVTRAHATRNFEADDMLFRNGKKDTLVMTEINFVPGGYWVAQWWYNIPPLGSPPAEYNFVWDAENIGLIVNTSGLHVGPENLFTPDDGYINDNFIVMSAFDAGGTNVQEEIMALIEGGDNIRIENSDGSKTVLFQATGALPLGEDRILVTIDGGDITYVGPGSEGFLHNESVKFINASAPTGLAENVEWNEFQYYHDHLDNGTDFCEAGRIQHFDFEYWNIGGLSGSNCDIFTCPDLIYDSEYVYMDRAFFPKGSSPQVLYVKGGQVLVRGVVDGQYTIVTDDFTEYRRHDDESKIDRVWGNIWLIDDIVYIDSNGNGEVIHPQDGGTNNILGLIAGGSVIIANTRPNGARGQQFGTDITINASILAMSGGFIAHYWQNSLQDYHDWDDGLAYGIIADGRGGHRNYYRSDGVNGIYTGDDDYRGYINLWGSIVQFKRGYMKRNYPGPYNVSPGIGYDKNYHYDWNLRMRPPPYFPDLQSANNAVILKMASYGELETF